MAWALAGHSQELASRLGLELLQAAGAGHRVGAPQDRFPAARAGQRKPCRTAHAVQVAGRGTGREIIGAAEEGWVAAGDFPLPPAIAPPQPVLGPGLKLDLGQGRPRPFREAPRADPDRGLVLLGSGLDLLGLAPE